MAATITDKNGNIIESLTQWDSNVSIYIHGLQVAPAPVIHFTSKNQDKTLPVGSEIDEHGVIKTVVPNILLEDDATIIIYVYAYNDDTKEGRTIERLTIPVDSKKKPDDYVYKENISVVNIVSLSNQIRVLRKMIPTGGFKRDNSLVFTRVEDGETMEIFTIDLQ